MVPIPGLEGLERIITGKATKGRHLVQMISSSELSRIHSSQPKKHIYDPNSAGKKPRNCKAANLDVRDYTKATSMTTGRDFCDSLCDSPSLHEKTRFVVSKAMLENYHSDLQPEGSSWLCKAKFRMSTLHMLHARK